MVICLWTTCEELKPRQLGDCQRHITGGSVQLHDRSLQVPQSLRWKLTFIFFKVASWRFCNGLVAGFKETFPVSTVSSFFFLESNATRYTKKYRRYIIIHVYIYTYYIVLFLFWYLDLASFQTTKTMGYIDIPDYLWETP